MKIQIYILIAILLCAGTLYGQDVAITGSSDRSLTFEFHPQMWKVLDIKGSDRSYTSVRFEGDEINSSPGHPMIPQRTIMIGIPVNASVKYSVIEITEGTRLQGRLAPVPFYTDDASYIEEPGSYQSQQIPENLISDVKTGYIRNQHVLRLRISPVRYFPQQNVIETIEKMVVRINFSSAGDAKSDQTQSGGDEAFYEGVLLNYEQAGKWRKTRQPAALKRSFSTLTNDMYKVFTKHEGVHKINGAMLLDAGISIQDINPATIQLFNNGGMEMPRERYRYQAGAAIEVVRMDSLIENAITVVDGGDNSFDESDYILFFAKSVNGWQSSGTHNTFLHYINHYTDENVFWLTWNNENGKRIDGVELPVDNQLPLTDRTIDHLYFEEDRENPIDSGIDWYGQSFENNGGSNLDTKNFTFNLKGAVPEDSTSVRVHVAGTSRGNHDFRFLVNDSYIGNTSFYCYTSKYTVIATSLFSGRTNNTLTDGYNKITLEYRAAENYAKAYLDWIEIDYTRRLLAIENKMHFYSPALQGTYRYQLSDFTDSDIHVFDISDFSSVKKFENLQISNGTVVFSDTVNTDRVKRYFATTSSNVLTPVRITKDSHASNLRNPSNQAAFIIIAHDDFYDQALELKSLRENCDNLKTEVVRISDVYDEFSWGLFDPVAIRDFIEYAFDNWAVQPQYVLLLGSGDFDYRNIADEEDNNWIPPYETNEKYEGDSRAWDDWYVCVSGNDEYIDLAIGRLPARNPDHAEHMIRKIIDYKNNPEYGDWRNTITFVADDEYGETTYGPEPEHTEQAETISENYIPRHFNINKIYLVEYPPVYTASITGIRKPAAQEAIVDAINNGTLIINYIGHGRYDLWAHEVVLDMDQDLQKIQTGRRQAFWVAGTCYFGRFDNPDYESMTEELLVMKENGAIGVLAAARLVGSAPNAALNKLFYQKLLPTAHSQVRIGDAVAMAKNARGNQQNDQKIILFSDPTLHLANPSISAKIESVSPDTIKALSKMTVSGEIRKDGQKWDAFSGDILLKAYDSKKSRTYDINENLSLDYWLPGNTIFRGPATVENGEFSFQFIVPKDITYGGRNGKLSIYLWNGDHGDGSGYISPLPVGGTNTSLFDKTGPEIRILMNGADIIESGYANQNPEMTIEITDSISGVNIAGDIGHSIMLTLDGKKENITDMFNYFNNSYISGSAVQQPGPLEAGEHNLTLKAWDNSNNSNEISARFTVIKNDKLILEDVLNYPNPFRSDTEFTFRINQDAECTIKIFTVAGRLLKTIDAPFIENGFNTVYWDGKDAEGDALANGVYLYKISARSQYDGRTISTEKIEKLMIMR
ncbi:MAG: type IX secretion system sortase PorU [candidate division KSB1 bacterium]|jgi:hypothetical protein|nr:type IX secretion system sortase PorU [candidate division KSB1 bacterium]